MNTFGELLQHHRKSKKISLRTMARLLEISPTFLSDIENNRRLPPTSEKNHNIIQLIISNLNLSNEQAEELKLAADKSLNGRGMISKDFEEYMSHAPKAQLAMRKAIDKNIGESKWEKIIEFIEED